jgi:hypothetical protein
MLAENVLGEDLDRTDDHSSIDDARVTMQLWLYHTTGKIPQLARGGIPVNCGDRPFSELISSTTDEVRNTIASESIAKLPLIYECFYFSSC